MKNHFYLIIVKLTYGRRHLSVSINVSQKISDKIKFNIKNNFKNISLFKVLQY